jgi:hypothetical protein
MSDVYSYEGDSYSTVGDYEGAATISPAVINAYSEIEEVANNGYEDSSIDSAAYGGGNAYESLYGDESGPETNNDDQSDVKVAKFIGKDWNEGMQLFLFRFMVGESVGESVDASPQRSLNQFSYFLNRITM